LKLLIDEMYPPVIAERLREAGHDAISVLDHPDVVGQDDLRVWEFAASNRRAIVTENAADFLFITRSQPAVGDAVPTLIVTSNRSFSRHQGSFIGRALRALSALCDEHPDDDPQVGAVHWLRPIT
jgi:predicted nuclease of predicted toxin-antitoxin system